MSYVIFSIDFENDPFRMNVFQNYCREYRQYMVGNVLPCHGKYEGKVEHSFLCAVEDFEDFFRASIYLKGQESILHVASGNQMEVSIEYLDTCTRHSLGAMHQVSADEALASTGYTFLPSTGNYYICKRGNPDGAYERSVVDRTTLITTPEKVEALIERLRIAYGGPLSRDCADTLRALLTRAEQAEDEREDPDGGSPLRGLYLAGGGI